MDLSVLPVGYVQFKPKPDSGKKPKSQRFEKTIFDYLPKDVLHYLFGFLIENAETLNEKYKKAYRLESDVKTKRIRYGNSREKTKETRKGKTNTWYGVHPLSYSQKWLRVLAQTCRSLNIKVKMYRSKLPDALKLLTIEKQMTQQRSKHRKAVFRHYNYIIAKTAATKMVMYHQKDGVSGYSIKIEQIAKMSERIFKKKISRNTNKKKNIAKTSIKK
jgi:hypothetical protein